MEHRNELGQPIREEGPAGHVVKQGTPVMGGLLIILCAVLPFFAMIVAVTVTVASCDRKSSSCCNRWLVASASRSRFRSNSNPVIRSLSFSFSALYPVNVR